MKNKKPSIHQNNILWLLATLWVAGLSFIEEPELQQLVLLAGVLIAITLGFRPTVNYFRQWLSEQEERELQEFDLKILAAENSFKFEEENEELSETIFSLLGHIRRSRNEFFNFISRAESIGQLHIFNHFTQTLIANKPNSFEVRLTGVAARLELESVPTFILLHKSVAHKASFIKPKAATHTFYRLDREGFPGWLHPNKFLCFYQKGQRLEVSRFLGNNRPLELLSNQSSIRLIGFKNELAFALFEEEIKIDGSNFDEFKSYATRLLEVQGDGILPPAKSPRF